MLHQKVVTKCFGHQVVVSFLIFQIYPRLIGGLFQAILQHFQCHLAKLVQPYHSEVFILGPRLPNNKHEDLWLTGGGPKKTYHPGITVHLSGPVWLEDWGSISQQNGKTSTSKCWMFFRVLNSAFQAERAPSNGGRWGHGALINSLIYKWVCLELVHPL